MKCKGISFSAAKNKRINCTKGINDNEEYCKAHIHQADYTKDQLEKMVKCVACTKLIYKKDENDRGDCDNCYNNKRSKMKKCKGTSALRGKKLVIKPCSKTVTDSDFCKIHTYMKDYTEEMLNNLTKCRRCHKMYYIEGEDDRCNECKAGVNKDKPRCMGKRVLRKTKVIDNCIDTVEKEGDFCKNHLHQKEYSKKEMKKLTICSGCCIAYYLVNETQCAKCKPRMALMKDKYPDKAESDSDCDEEIPSHKCTAFKLKEIDGNIEKKYAKCKQNKITDTEYCKKHQYQSELKEHDITDLIKCNKCSHIFVYENYRSCLRCEKTTKKQQSEDKDLRHDIGFCKRINPRNKKQCKNIGFMGGWCSTHFHKFGDDQELDQNKLNEEQTIFFVGYRKIIDETKIKPHVVLKRCKRSAESRNIKWTLTDTEALKMIKSPCYYCNKKDDAHLCGIDRLISVIHYNTDNCVPCCAMCNMMKIHLDVNIFINMCHHIAVYNKHLEGELDHDLFPNNKKSYYYQEFITNAKKRDLEVTLTESEYKNIINDSCYICGKTAGPTKNFIDRFDSRNEYTSPNSKPCCKTCNIMKATYKYDKFMDHIKLIATKFHDKINDLKYDLTKDNNHIICRNIKIN